MGDVLQFPSGAAARIGFERVKSTYSLREICEQFGLPERTVRRWTDAGLIQTVPGLEDGEVGYDFRALTQFRKVRELRAKGRTLKQIDQELRGQMNLFEEARGQLLQLPVRLSPFEEALLLDEREEAGAADAYRKAIESEDYVADAYCNLGILEHDDGEVVRAFDCLTTALKHDPRHFESHFNLAYLYFETEDLRLARLHYELAAEIEPSFANLYFNLGLVHAMRGDLERAVVALERLRELAPEDDTPEIGDLLASVQNALKLSAGRRGTTRH